MASQTRLTADEIGRRGEAIYEERLREQAEANHAGSYISIDIHSGEYEIAKKHMDATDRLRARVPDAEIYNVWTGCQRLSVGMIRIG